MVHFTLINNVSSVLYPSYNESRTSLSSWKRYQKSWNGLGGMEIWEHFRRQPPRHELIGSHANHRKIQGSLIIQIYYNHRFYWFVCMHHYDILQLTWSKWHTTPFFTIVCPFVFVLHAPKMLWWPLADINIVGIEHICNHLNIAFNKVLLISAEILIQQKTSVTVQPSNYSVTASFWVFHSYPICPSFCNCTLWTNYRNPASCSSNHYSATSTSSSSACCNSGWHYTIFTRCWKL